MCSFGNVTLTHVTWLSLYCSIQCMRYPLVCCYGNKSLCCCHHQAVVRGRRLRQQLSQARQAATYTDDSHRHDSHESDLDMEQMDDFLASLPDDEPSPAPPLTSTSPPAHMRALSRTLAPAVAVGIAPVLSPLPALSTARPHAVLPLPDLTDTRQSSHASASTSGRIPPSSSSSHHQQAASLPMEPPQSSSGHERFSEIAAGLGSSFRQSIHRSHSTSVQNPLVSARQMPHRSLSSSETLNAGSKTLNAGSDARQHPQPSSSVLHRQGSYLQQQQPFLPALTGNHTTAVAHAGSTHPHTSSASWSTTHNTVSGSHFSLPPIQESVDEVSTSPVDPLGASTASAADMVTDVGDREEEQDMAGASSHRSARVSRASSSVRSEQSMSSQSADKAAAKEQRHKVGCCMNTS